MFCIYLKNLMKSQFLILCFHQVNLVERKQELSPVVSISAYNEESNLPSSNVALYDSEEMSEGTSPSEGMSVHRKRGSSVESPPSTPKKNDALMQSGVLGVHNSVYYESSVIICYYWQIHPCSLLLENNSWVEPWFYFTIFLFAEAFQKLIREHTNTSRKWHQAKTFIWKWWPGTFIKIKYLNFL